MKKSYVSLVAYFLGVIFVLGAFMYWFTGANSLPSFMPGFDPTSTKIHFKHGLASLLLGLGIFAYAWFSGGKKSST